MNAVLTAGPLTRVAATGVVGLPDVDLELGPVTALVGSRGSGKSQLLSAVSWLLDGRPRVAARDPLTQLRVTADVRSGEVTRLIVRRPGIRLAAQPRLIAGADLPACSFLRARDRFAPPSASGGAVAARLATQAGRPTSDAAAAEALVSVVEACCADCVAGEVLLIEEPELLLTPQAQRYLYRLLRQFAENGNTVMYSTRSPAFLDAAHHDEIVRLDLRDGHRTVRRTSPRTLTDAERVRLAGQFDHERSEMFFARAVVLVEGQTERLSLPFVFRALGHDPDAEGVAIVEVGGKSNLPIAARLLGQLAIPFVVVLDADRGTASAVLDNQIRRAAGRAPTIRLDPDFEAAAGIAAHGSKVFEAWQRFAGPAPARVPPALGAIVEAVMAAGDATEPGTQDRP